MKKMLICLFAITFCTNCPYPLNHIHTTYAQQKPIPPYAKWGVMAMKKTKDKYPNSQIIDYLHIGRISGESSSTERFKFWLKDNKQEFGVYVNIEFKNDTEKVLNITFKETND